ncbi:Isopentenyldiphosphate isomerase [Psychrobacillus sp. OK028]|uniref:NUDIX hydrolase n=1 Tax=Psychrobacillus sp. OK028 TaxID=1884359 RepID=UPI0008836B13|nr:NUDIX domain-containing protein [Psychrobacillus sp. OK028]SDO10475.1 Isopentenyldiphosphate isomerase [Psychrobacillus sp. OK028]
MEQELLKVFDEQHKQIGVETREEIHKLGLWHETFQCWFIGKNKGKEYVYLQLRSDLKKDYPGLLDITAAGHLLESETVIDGIREVKEELGIDVLYEELYSLGVMKYSVTTGDFVDNELAHVFLYDCALEWEQFTLQAEEVSGIVRVEISQFVSLWQGELEEIEVIGFKVEADGTRSPIHQKVEKASFVPHEQSYYEEICKELISFPSKNQLSC